MIKELKKVNILEKFKSLAVLRVFKSFKDGRNGRWLSKWKEGRKTKLDTDSYTHHVEPESPAT